MKTVKNLRFGYNDYPDVMDVANKLAGLEHRRVHDALRRLIIEAGNRKIKELSTSSEIKK